MNFFRLQLAQEAALSVHGAPPGVHAVHSRAKPLEKRRNFAVDFGTDGSGGPRVELLNGRVRDRARVWKMSREKFNEVLAGWPQLAYAMVEILSQRLDATSPMIRVTLSLTMSRVIATWASSGLP